MSDFFTLYRKLKAEYPGFPEEYYHRVIQEELGYDCPHPFLLLRIGSANGCYLKSEIDRAYPRDKMKVIERWMKDSVNKSALWCPVCQTYPYR